MESLNPGLNLLITVRRNIEKGQSVRFGIQQYICKNSGDFNDQVSKWLSLWQQGLPTGEIVDGQISVQRSALLKTLEKGLQGIPIYNNLLNMEQDMTVACEASLTESIARLPFLLLIPLLLFQMPAFLILLFGPLLRHFFEAMGAK